MAYIEQSLGRNEALLHRARLAGLYDAFAWGLLAVFLVPAAAAHQNGQQWPVVAVLAIAGVILFLAIEVLVWSTEIGVANERFVFKRSRSAGRRTNSIYTRLKRLG
jgi:hypothetical protein